VGAVVVVDHDHVVGILTDRDVATKIIAGNAAADSPVESIMTKKVITIWDDQGIFNATQYLRGHKLRRLPIIDRQERLVGMLTADDLFAMLARELLNVAESLEPAIGVRV
ncbi:MAG: CBS domain-containing protein, partial [Planctomycetota bacterium]